MHPDSTDIGTDTKANARWKLIVQGVVLEYHQPKVKAADAMADAGFDPQKAWHIYLIVHGQKTEITPDTIVDLSTPGIEKIRLMQRNVDNGEGQQPAPRRLFKLLASDHEYLDALGLRWETVLEGEDGRWLLIHDYRLPAGFAPITTTLALAIAKDYPAAQIDMFYFTPFVGRTNGAVIPNIQVRAKIGGVEYQGWSRHRNAAAPWDSATDSVRTHLALVESCLAKEIGE
jgi:hypothetical protein